MTTQLSAQDRALLNTDFGEEIEKVAAAQAEAIQEAYAYGFAKLAAEAADTKDEEDKKHEEHESKKDEEKEEKKMDEESEKAAAELGAFIERGFFDGLRKLGAERHGNEFHYVEPFVQEKIALSAGLKASAKVKRLAQTAAEKIKAYHTQMVDDALMGAKGRPITHRGGTGGRMTNPALADISAGERAKHIGKAALRASPYAALVGGGVYGGSKLVGGSEGSAQ